VIEWCLDEGITELGETVRYAHGTSWNDPPLPAERVLRFLPTVRYPSLGIRIARVPVDTAADRKAAEVGLGQGGMVKVNADSPFLRTIDELTADPLRLTVIRDTRIDNTGMAAISKCKNVKTLSLYGANLGDAGVAHLKNWTGLQHLHLAGTKVSDAGLASFKA